MMEVSALKDIKNKSITLIKRDGREEPFTKAKLKKVCMWATNDNDGMTEQLLRDTEIKLRDKVKITSMYKNLIDTAVSKVSRLQPQWQFVASKLYLLELYSEAYGIKDKTYPHLGTVIAKGVSAGVYSRELLNTYTPEEIDELNNYIRPEMDYKFTYQALKQFNVKYCKNYSKTKKLELPQVTYMRVAMGLFHNKGEDKIDLIKKLYDIITDGYATLATPIMMNSFTNLNSFASCILNTIGNNTWDIMNKIATAGLYTKGRGGVAFDISHIQAKGSMTNNGVKTGGIVPFVQNIQSVVNSMMQGDNRRGAAVITCNWWHLEIEDFLQLKDASSGTEENRALHLQYSFATNDLFMEAVEANEDIYLLDPLDVPELLYVYGDEFKALYDKAINKHGNRRKKVNARELYQMYLKYRFQTGNVYEIMVDNVNKANMTNRYIGSSNLCSEILEPSRPGRLIEETVVTEGKKEYMVTKFENEEIALCNLASFNCNIYSLGRAIYDDIVYTVSLALDNTIDIGRYMRVAGEYTNMKYRYIGLGYNNYANYMARQHTLLETTEAEVETFKLFQGLSNSILRANIRMAAELGTFPAYRESKWKEGTLPYDLSNEHLRKKYGYLVDHAEEREIRHYLNVHGMRNALTSAVAPTASSATSKDLTESIEPILDYSYELRGAVNTTVLVPEFQELNQYYSLAYEVPQEKLVLLNAIRQMFIDQSQSFNMYIKEENWNYKYLAELHILSWKLGMKTQYYLNTPKMDIKDSCESCSS